ncbi:MAG: hypothetical protein IJZ72_05885 [Oscillospiraceae bacterium]|nr:hypothetical protein [Oscillospiraceae bacterium]
MELVILLIIWLISPIVLLIIAISQGSKAKDYQHLYRAEVKKNLKLENELRTLKNPPPSEAEAPPENASEETAQPESTPAESDEEKQKKAYSPYDMSYQTAASVKPVQTETPKPESKPEPEPKAEKAAETPPPAEKKQRVSSINVLFIIGALFIITAGLIFATTTWEFLSSGIRAIVILSLSAIFFAASSLAERKFNIQKTGMLFYTLGSVFLPITLVAAGYFKVFGEWFSLDGEGRPLLLAITFAALSAVSLKGGCDYKSKPFSWCGLVSFSAAVSCLILQFTESMAMFALISSIYSFGMIFACTALSKITSEKLSPVISQLNTFASANTIILSISSLAAAFGDGEGALTFASCAIFAAGYLKNSFTQKNGFAGAVPFTIFATCGVFAVSAADDMSEYAVTLVFATAIPAVLSFMNFFPEKLKTAVTVVSNIFSIFAAALCAVTSFFAEPSVLTLAAYAILAAEVLALYIFHKNEKSGRVMLSVFPVPCLMIVVIASRFIFEGTYEEPLGYTTLFAMALIAALQALFILIKPLKLRTSASDYIFSSAAVIACTALLAADVEINPLQVSNSLLSLAGVIISSGTVLMPIIGLDTKKRLPFIGSALLWTGTAVFPLYDILPILHDYDVTVACGAVMLVHAVISVLATIFCKDSTTEKLITVITRIVSGIFIIASLPSSFAYPLFLILTAAVIFRGVRHNNNTEFGAGLILFFMTVLVTSIELLSADFHESWMFASGAAAIVYLSALFMPSGKLVKTADNVSRYTLLVLNTISLIYVCDMYSPEPVFIAMTALFFLLTLTSFYNEKHTPPLFLPLLLIYPAIVSVIDGCSETIFVSFVIAAVALLTLIPSFILHRERLFEKDDKLINMDVFAFARFAAFSCYMGSAYDNVQSWCGLVLLTLCILSLYRKTQPVVLKKWIFTIAAFVPVIAWISQPFFIVPDIIVLEYSIIPFLLFCFAMRYMWKDSLALVDNLTFAVYIISFLILFFDAMTGEYVADGLIIVISALAMLIFSFIVKKKKWFILGVAVIVTATLFMSRNFWASLAWWVYLLAAGLLLIAIAAANELKKQAAAKNEKSEFEQKLTRFMSEWTW